MRLCLLALLIAFTLFRCNWSWSASVVGTKDLFSYLIYDVISRDQLRALRQGEVYSYSERRFGPDFVLPWIYIVHYIVTNVQT